MLNAYFHALSLHPQAAQLQQVLGLYEAKASQNAAARLAYHPLVLHLGASVLEDAGSSNHHLLAPQGALTGHVVYLSHDGDSRPVFASWADWLRAAERALQQGCEIAELHPLHSPVAPDQDALAAALQALVAADASDAAVALLPSLNLTEPRHAALLQAWALDDDFYLGEALALQIALRPDARLQTLAERCAAHPHPQVAQAGLTALRALHALRRPSSIQR